MSTANAIISGRATARDRLKAGVHPPGAAPDFPPEQPVARRFGAAVGGRFPLNEQISLYASRAAASGCRTTPASSATPPRHLRTCEKPAVRPPSVLPPGATGSHPLGQSSTNATRAERGG
jgi:hypothetical protein